MFWIYAMLVHLVFLPAMLFFGLHPKLRGGFYARMGCYPRDWLDRVSKPVVWFHGASAGDVSALRPVISAMREKTPESFILVTTLTNSGYVVAAGLQQIDAYSYAPFDLPWVVKKSVERIRPDLLVLECAEIWPAWLRAAKKYGTRIAVVNGRFSSKLLGKYRSLYRLIGNPLKLVDLFCMQDEIHAKNVIHLGADAHKVRVMGNTKLDTCNLDAHIDPNELKGLARDLGLRRRFVEGCAPESDPRPLVIVAGSTHDKEEQMLLDGYLRLRARFDGLRLVLAPRYIERAKTVAAMARRRGLSCAYRSEGAHEESVVILDTVGELRSAYLLASVVVVGGSFVPRGGHNILEPAACGKPVVFGPHMENNQIGLQVLLGRGGIQVRDAVQLEACLSELLANRHDRKRLGAEAQAAVSSAQGAGRACFRALSDLLQA